MSTPSGTLITSIVQTRDRNKLNWSYLLIFAAIAIIAIIRGDSGASNSLGILVAISCLAVPLIAVIAASANVRKELNRLDVYSDGFVIKGAANDGVIESALWNEVSDIRTSADKGKDDAFGLGYLTGGVLGGLMASAATGDTDQRDLYLTFANDKRLTLDASYTSPQPASPVVMETACAAWVQDAAQTIDHGGRYACGEIYLTPTGLCFGSHTVEWKQILGVARDRKQQLTVTFRSNVTNDDQNLRVKLGYKSEVLARIIRAKLAEPQLGA